MTFKPLCCQTCKLTRVRLNLRPQFVHLYHLILQAITNLPIELYGANR